MEKEKGMAIHKISFLSANTCFITMAIGVWSRGAYAPDDSKQGGGNMPPPKSWPQWITLKQ